MADKLRPEQIEVTTGTSNNDTLPTLGKVEDMISPENTWDRDISGTPFLKPANVGDYLHLNEAENVSFYVTSDLQIFRNATPDISMWAANATATADSNLNLVRSRGTIASPAAVQDNDLIGNINFVAFSDASTRNNGAEIRAEIDGTPSVGNLPCKLGFYVNAGAGVATLGMELQKDKNLELQGIFKCDQIAELTGGSGVIIESLNIDGIQLGGADVHIVAASGDIQLSATSGTTQVISGTFSLATGTTVNNIVTGIGSLSTDNMLATAKTIYDDFAYLGGKIGGQTISGGFGLNEDLDLQSTFAATKGEVRVRDGSDFVFVSSGGNGLFKVEENADAKIYLGRAMISSPTTDVMYLSHYDMGDSNTDYAIKQLPTGRTAVNSKSGLPLDLAINNVTKVSVNAVTTTINNNLDVNTGTFALATGTTVNEIITTVDASSTDNQIPTGKAVYDAVLSADKVAVPATPTSSGITGQWAYGSNYEYRCIATDTWVRKLVVTSW